LWISSFLKRKDKPLPYW